MTKKKPLSEHKTNYWTLEEDAFLWLNYHNRGPQWCAEALQAQGFKRTRSAVDNRGHNLGLVYIGPPIGRIKKGNIPANKGKKMSPELKARIAHTFYKKGNRTGAANNNYVPIGHESLRKDYWYVKVAEGKWELKHRVIWEKHHGPIPAGHLVIFRDGNPNNFSLDNLELVSKTEHVYRNRHGAGPTEYGLLSGRTARNRLKRQKFGARTIRENPDLLKIAQAQTLISLAKRKKK